MDSFKDIQMCPKEIRISAGANSDTEHGFKSCRQIEAFINLFIRADGGLNQKKQMTLVARDHGSCCDLGRIHNAMF